MAGEVAIEADDAAGEQARAAPDEALQQGLLPGSRLPEDGAEHRAPGAGGDRDNPELRERRGVIRSPGGAEERPVRRRVRQVHQHPVRRGHGQPRQHHRRRLVIAGERARGLPEQVLHHVRGDQQPPVRDHFPRRDMPFQDEGDVREQPRQPGQRLAIGGVRHQRHHDHQPDDQRIGHDPPPLPRPQPAFHQRRVHDGLDHAVTEMTLQLAQPDQAGQPRVRQDRPVPADHGGRGHHRAAEHRKLPRRRHAIPGRDRHAANPQASSPDHDRSRRSPPRGLLRPDCSSGGRQARLHKGLL